MHYLVHSFDFTARHITFLCEDHTGDVTTFRMYKKDFDKIKFIDEGEDHLITRRVSGFGLLGAYTNTEIASVQLTRIGICQATRNNDANYSS